MHRPWDQREGGGGVQGQGGEGGRGTKASPLDALFNMISNNDALTAKSGKQGRKEWYNLLWHSNQKVQVSPTGIDLKNL